MTRIEVAGRGNFMQLNMFGVSEVQTSTMQVPVGSHSIFDALEFREVSPADATVYLKINEFSNWETGNSHSLSYTTLSKLLRMPRSQVIASVKSLIAKGWLEKNVRNTTAHTSQNVSNTYRVVHHKCDPLEVPRDKDGLPKKCAMPRGEGSPSEMLEHGRISWRDFLYWVVSKVESNWTTGVVELTISQVRRILRFSRKMVSQIRKRLGLVGLLEQLSSKCRAFVGQLYPKPYDKRHKRRRENPKGMRCDAKFYYSFNERWKISREDGTIYAKEGSQWRFANEYELESKNKKIYADFMFLREMIHGLSAYRLRFGERASV